MQQWFSQLFRQLKARIGLSEPFIKWLLIGLLKPMALTSNNAPLKMGIVAVPGKASKTILATSKIWVLTPSLFLPFLNKWTRATTDTGLRTWTRWTHISVQSKTFKTWFRNAIKGICILWLTLIWTTSAPSNMETSKMSFHSIRVSTITKRQLANGQMPNQWKHAGWMDCQIWTTITKKFKPP